jgi:NAD(P)-dependent dehydrogenase (short-subunit alcohol dehydrogenase family)
MTTHSSDLENQTALVTGATSGIGRAIALQLARQGAEVLVHGRDVQRGATTVEAITAAGGKARFVAANLSDPADLQRLVDTIGEVDVLVNNAGFSWFGPTADLNVETFDALFVSNVRAPFFLVAGIAPKMAARGYGSIINVSSMAGQIGLAGGAAYGATKATLSSMTRAWAAEFSPRGVRVNAIALVRCTRAAPTPSAPRTWERPPSSNELPTPMRLLRSSHSSLRPGRATSPAPSSQPMAGARPSNEESPVRGPVELRVRPTQPLARQPLRQANGHRVPCTFSDRMLKVGLDRQLVRSVAKCHERTLERLMIDRTADLHQTTCSEKLHRVGHHDIRPPALARTLLQRGAELFVQSLHFPTTPPQSRGRSRPGRETQTSAVRPASAIHRQRLRHGRSNPRGSHPHWM